MDHPIRILMINPNSDESTCALIRKTVERFPKTGCVVDVMRLATAPVLVATYEDRIIPVQELIQLLREKEDQYDAFVLACHADPNLELAQEISSKPVVGIGGLDLHSQVREQLHAGVDRLPHIHINDITPQQICSYRR